MSNNGKNNFADAVAMKVRYAVLTKKSRIEVLVKPTAKQLRKRGRKGWHLFRAIDSETEALSLLEEGFKTALGEIEGNGRSANGKKRKFQTVGSEV
jgi:hypothetical protein